MPPKYSPGHPINITVPPIFGISLPRAMEAATEIVDNALCPVIWPSPLIASYSHKKQIFG